MSRSHLSQFVLAVTLFCCAILFACGGSSSNTSIQVPTGSNSGGTPSGNGVGGGSSQINHVVLVVLENASYSDVIGNSAMPYLNSLANSYSLATNYFADVHPSIGNYFIMTTGQVVTIDDNFTGKVTVDNFAKQFAKDNKSWKVYVEGVQVAGYLGGNTGTYLKRHNPFSYFSDVTDNSIEAAKLVPFSQFAGDIASLPNFAMLVPDVTHDAHDCPAGSSTCTLNDKLAAADQWLKTNVDPLVTSSAFQSSGLLVITFDESEMTDLANGGGHVATVLVGGGVKQGYKSTSSYQHQDLEAMMAHVLHLSSTPGAGAISSTMSEFFK